MITIFLIIVIFLALFAVLAGLFDSIEETFRSLKSLMSDDDTWPPGGCA